MLAKRIVPCLDVKNGQVVKGVKFKNHVVLGGILELAKRYRDEGADELVFYDITASVEDRSVSKDWVKETARLLDIPFCVAGGIRSVRQAGEVLNAGADKISINSPAIERPELITELAHAFGSQAVVVGVDSNRAKQDNDYLVYQYTGSEAHMRTSRHYTMRWLHEVQERGAGEVVLNCMGSDGVGTGYDVEQLKLARAKLRIPLVASGGAGAPEHFETVFKQAKVDAALAAGVFHRRELPIKQLKAFLGERGIEVRP
jgi:imidazole glycerol-phosphate synthase subunit HisF